MLDTSEAATRTALNDLFDRCKGGTEPFIFWIGAGVSRWCGYSSWQDLAARFHSEYSKKCSNYDRKIGATALASNNYPALFQLCKEADPIFYYETLSQQFPPKTRSPVYRRFVAAINTLNPKFIITTNIDNLLEQSLIDTSIVHRKDIARVVNLATRNQSFLLMLHGTSQDLESSLFTSEEYESVANDREFLSHLRMIIGGRTIIFLGCGLQEQYLLHALHDQAQAAFPFPSGPHFAVLPVGAESSVVEIKPIHYFPEPHADHRCIINVVEEIGNLHGSAIAVPQESFDWAAESELRSAHFLSDIYPPGTWTTSKTLSLESDTGAISEFVIGDGMTNGERLDHRSRALHDLIVGLLCFDEVIAPLPTIAKLHNLLGPPQFWELVEDKSLMFILWERTEGMFFEGKECVTGDLRSLGIYNADMSEKTVMQLIKGEIKANPGFEKEAEKLFDFAAQRTVKIGAAEEGPIAGLTRSLLMRPTIRRALGISDGTPLFSLPRWSMFPVIRLANVVKMGATCRILRTGSARLDEGSDKLAGLAFSAARGGAWASDAASYVLTGRYGSDLGTLVATSPEVLRGIITFRRTEMGRRLRKEITQALAARAGAEVDIAINASLKGAIPAPILESARASYSTLYTTADGGSIQLPALWNDPKLADEALSRWRKQSKNLMHTICSDKGIGRNDLCPCGSGDKFKACCLASLS